MPIAQPVSYVKSHLAEVIDSVRTTGESVTVTQNGIPSVVMVDHQAYEEQRKALALLKLVAMGRHDVELGRTTPQKDVFRRLKKKLDARLASETA